MLINVLGGCARAESRHADKGAAGTDELVPAEPDRSLDGDIGRGVADRLAAIGFGLGTK